CRRAGRHGRFSARNGSAGGLRRPPCGSARAAGAACPLKPARAPCRIQPFPFCPAIMSSANQPQYKQPISALVVVYTPELETLIIERTDYKDAWQSVTGSLEAGETPRDAALRELGEELGIDPSQYELQDWGLENQWEIYERWRHRYAPGVIENT